MLPSAASYRFLRPPCWIEHACHVIMIMIYSKPVDIMIIIISVSRTCCTPRFQHVVPSLKIWERVEQGNQTQRTKTRTVEPREPKNNENHKNQRTTRTRRTTRTTRTRRTRQPREPESHKNQRIRRTTKKNGTRRRFYVTKSNKRNVMSAVAITLEISCYTVRRSRW